MNVRQNGIFSYNSVIHRSQGQFGMPIMIVRAPYGVGVRALEHHSGVIFAGIKTGNLFSDLF